MSVGAPGALVVCICSWCWCVPLVSVGGPGALGVGLVCLYVPTVFEVECTEEIS